jgi:hypothetical protein
MPSQDLLQAIRLARSGDKDAARKILEGIIQKEPYNEMAWIWLVDTLPTDGEKLSTLNRCLLVIPNSQNARKALAAVKSRMNDTAADVPEANAPTPAAAPFTSEPAPTDAFRSAFFSQSEPEPSEDVSPNDFTEDNSAAQSAQEEVDPSEKAFRDFWENYKPESDAGDLDINRTLESFLREEEAYEQQNQDYSSPFSIEEKPADKSEPAYSDQPTQPPAEEEQQPFVAENLQSEWMDALRQDQLESLAAQAARPPKPAPQPEDQPAEEVKPAKEPETEEQKKKRRRRTLVIGLSVLALIVVAAAVYILFLAPFALLGGGGAPPAEPVPVDIPAEATPEGPAAALVESSATPEPTQTATLTLTPTATNTPAPTATTAPAIRLGTSRISSIAWLKDGSGIVIAYSAGAVVYSADTFEQLRMFTAPAERNICSLASRKAVLACGGSGLNFWDIETGGLIATYDLPDATGERITALTAMNNTDDVLVGYDLPEPNMRIIFSLDGTPVNSMVRSDAQIVSVADSYNGVTATFATADGALYRWTINSGDLLELRAPSEKVLTDVQYSPDNAYVAASGENGMVVLWNPQSGQRLITFENNTPSRAIIFDNNSHWLAAGYDDGSVILWSVNDGAQLTTLPQGSSAVNALALSPDGTRMAVGYADGSVEFYPVSLP